MAREVRVPREEQTSSKRKLWEKIINDADQPRSWRARFQRHVTKTKAGFSTQHRMETAAVFPYYILSDCPFTVWRAAFHCVDRLHDDNSTRVKASRKHPPTYTVRLGSFTMNVDFKHKTVLLIIWCGGLITELKLVSRFGYLPRCPIPPVEPEFIANMCPPRIFNPA